MLLSEVTNQEKRLWLLNVQQLLADALPDDVQVVATVHRINIIKDGERIITIVSSDVKLTAVFVHRIPSKTHRTGSLTIWLHDSDWRDQLLKTVKDWL